MSQGPPLAAPLAPPADAALRPRLPGAGIMQAWLPSPYAISRQRLFARSSRSRSVIGARWSRRSARSSSFMSAIAWPRWRRSRNRGRCRRVCQRPKRWTPGSTRALREGRCRHEGHRLSPCGHRDVPAGVWGILASRDRGNCPGLLGGRARERRLEGRALRGVLGRGVPAAAGPGNSAGDSVGVGGESLAWRRGACLRLWDSCVPHPVRCAGGPGEASARHLRRGRPQGLSSHRVSARSFARACAVATCRWSVFGLEFRP